LFLVGEESRKKKKRGGGKVPFPLQKGRGHVPARSLKLKRFRKKRGKKRRPLIGSLYEGIWKKEGKKKQPLFCAKEGEKKRKKRHCLNTVIGKKEKTRQPMIVPPCQAAVKEEEKKGGRKRNRLYLRKRQKGGERGGVDPISLHCHVGGKKREKKKRGGKQKWVHHHIKKAAGGGKKGRGKSPISRRPVDTRKGGGEKSRDRLHHEHWKKGREKEKETKHSHLEQEKKERLAAAIMIFRGGRGGGKGKSSRPNLGRRKKKSPVDGLSFTPVVQGGGRREKKKKRNGWVVIEVFLTTGTEGRGRGCNVVRGLSGGPGGGGKKGRRGRELTVPHPQQSEGRRVTGLGRPALKKKEKREEKTPLFKAKKRGGKPEKVSGAHNGRKGPCSLPSGRERKEGRGKHHAIHLLHDLNKGGKGGEKKGDKCRAILFLPKRPLGGGGKRGECLFGQR